MDEPWDAQLTSFPPPASPSKVEGTGPGPGRGRPVPGSWRPDSLCPLPPFPPSTCVGFNGMDRMVGPSQLSPGSVSTRLKFLPPLLLLQTATRSSLGEDLSPGFASLPHPVPARLANAACVWGRP